MQVILIGNYLQDHQESMERFALMLQSGFEETGIQSEIWRPTVFFGKWAKSAHTGLGKWLGYIDKWLIFPLIIRWHLLNRSLQQTDVLFHICDHSNSPYLAHLPKDRTGITCHDVLAIRGAMGYTDAYCPASGFGKILQRWILSNLREARFLAADTQNTLDQLNELTQSDIDHKMKWRVIHIGFNNEFYLIEESRRKALLQGTGVSAKLFLLCVGSGLLRKNRKLLIDMAVALGERWQGYLCFAGQAVDDSLLAYAELHGVKERVVSVVEPDHDTLLALYSACEVLVFPSFSEGFGWPVIEAQACGAPVIASSLAPMPEVSGGAAMHADPYHPQAFANALVQLQDKTFRNDLIQRGYINCRRFESARMITAYLDLYGMKTVQQLPV